MLEKSTFLVNIFQCNSSLNKDSFYFSPLIFFGSLSLSHFFFFCSVAYIFQNDTLLNLFSILSILSMYNCFNAGIRLMNMLVTLDWYLSGLWVIPERFLYRLLSEGQHSNPAYKFNAIKIFLDYKSWYSQAQCYWIIRKLIQYIKYFEMNWGQCFFSSYSLGNNFEISSL